jgi:hypothetical protein
VHAASPTVRRRILEMVFESMRMGSAWLPATSTVPNSIASRPPATTTCASSGGSPRMKTRWPPAGSSRSTGRPRDEDRRNVEYLVSGSARSRLGRLLKQPASWREHTAQVAQDDRLEREARFRFTRKGRDEWLEKTGARLDKSIRGLLDMNAEHAPLAERLRQALDAEAPQRRAHARGISILAVLI